MAILYNDRLTERDRIHVDIEDRAYQFGDGIYEVIRVYEGRPFCLSEHIQRFERSAEEIRLQLPYGRKRLEGFLQELIAKNRLKDGTVYLQASRGAAPRSHPFPDGARPVIIAYTQEAPRPLQFLEQGIQATLTKDIRWLRCDIKTLNLLGAVLAKQYAVERGCQEAILHRDGRVTEGSATNVFLVKDGILYTHPANHLILHGITRAVTIEAAKEEGIPCREEAFTTDSLFRADELFVTGTTTEISPVISIDGRKVNKGTPGPITRKLQQAFEKRI
ncbi:D-amino-acid transaminase [Paludifilum halophilum]|uniref:D-alanine aminotransferase n=1 Tax=Paludifilum halophilum TaxID=1642702 RepID=A0A235BC37_9BACL|nr:D-amino-acid transaminase [Paludifilum halophilum]OYD09856.1 D-amino-acid transaminase [Paludifilum halophilum]